MAFGDLKGRRRYFSASPASHVLGHVGDYVPRSEKRREGGQTAHGGEQPEMMLLRYCSCLTVLLLVSFSPNPVSQNLNQLLIVVEIHEYYNFA